LWAKTYNPTVYVKNRSSHRILEIKTPKEDYSGKRPDVGHFNIFQSPVYFDVTKYAWNNIEATTKLGIFVWYTNTPHNY